MDDRAPLEAAPHLQVLHDEAPAAVPPPRPAPETTANKSARPRLRWQPITTISVGGGAEMEVVTTHSFLKNRDNGYHVGASVNGRSTIFCPPLVDVLLGVMTNLKEPNSKVLSKTFNEIYTSVITELKEASNSAAAKKADDRQKAKALRNESLGMLTPKEKSHYIAGKKRNDSSSDSRESSDKKPRKITSETRSMIDLMSARLEERRANCCRVVKGGHKERKTGI